MVRALLMMIVGGIAFTALVVGAVGPDRLFRGAKRVVKRILVDESSPEKTTAEAPVRVAALDSSAFTRLDVAVDNGPVNGWRDWGWAPRDIRTSEPTRINFSDYQGWIIRNPKMDLRAEELRVQLKPSSPKVKGFFRIRFGTGKGIELPSIKDTDAHAIKKMEDGWFEYRFSVKAMNPDNLVVDRIMLKAYRAVPDDWTLVRSITLWGDASKKPVAGQAALRTVGAQPARDFDSKPAELSVQCGEQGHAINPLIYGTAFVPRYFSKKPEQFEIGATARRWGGNPASRYNWKLGNAWNTAADWFFSNVNYTGEDGFSWKDFIRQNKEHGMRSVITIPLLGWVAKDTKSYSYPVSVYGKQARVSPYKKDVGNGVGEDGEPIVDIDPRRTSEEMSAGSAGAWAKEIKAFGSAANGQKVDLYYLGNEPMLWHETHRDVRKEPMGYDELLERNIAFGEAVRKHDKQALIGGPSVWGWPAYNYSARDKDAGFLLAPDRRAHGNLPLIAWYLREMKKHDSARGKDRILNLLNVHFYPQGRGVYGGSRIDMETAQKRIRSTRALWDESYTDESWIDDEIALFPRLKRWIDEYYPGLGISVGEYNFGGENHASGGIALAEALGRFAQFDVQAAFYWTFPKSDSPAGQAFHAYRNYDGKGGHFLDTYVPTKSTDGVSLFASTDSSRGLSVLVAINKSASFGAASVINFDSCGEVGEVRAFRYDLEHPTLAPVETGLTEETSVRDILPPWSITVYEVGLLR